MKPLNLIFQIGMLTGTLSCAGLHTGRSFVSEMGQEHSSFFNPYQDFPVVGGDTGRAWMSEEERQLRTPASAEEYAFRKQGRSIRQQLLALERQQSEEGERFYQKHRASFPNDSERIYFLQLPDEERAEYLAAKGYLPQDKSHPVQFRPPGEQPSQSQITLGMSKTDVAQSFGEPVRVEVAGNPTNENERWLYKANGATKYIYFEGGLVEGWE
jgi:hypothetical protein